MERSKPELITPTRSDFYYIVGVGDTLYQTVSTMEENKTAVNTTEPAAVQTDAEAKIAALEAEKQKIQEESTNWKQAFFKEKNRKENREDDENLDEDERMAKIAAKAITDSRLAEIAREQDAIIKQALKENKELKMAQMNKNNTAPPAGTTASTESTAVRDTLISPEQMAYFKSRGWTDKDIERYKKNLNRNIR